MDDLLKTKRSLKEWETAFFIVHQRRPTKTDISGAPDNIKGLYREYYAAKKNDNSALRDNDQKNVVADGVSTPALPFSSVWGPELNRSQPNNGEKGDATDKKKGGGNLLRFGEKLFARCGSSSLLSASSSVKKSGIFGKPDNDTLASPVVKEPTSSHTPSVSAVTHDNIDSKTIKPDASDFRLKGEMFEKAFRLSTGKKRVSSDDIQVPAKFMNDVKPRRQISLGQKMNLDSFNPEDGQNHDGDSCRENEGNDNFDCSRKVNVVYKEKSSSSRKLDPVLNGKTVSVLSDANPLMHSATSTANSDHEHKGADIGKTRLSARASRLKPEHDPDSFVGADVEQSVPSFENSSFREVVTKRTDLKSNFKASQLDTINEFSVCDSGENPNVTSKSESTRSHRVTPRSQNSHRSVSSLISSKRQREHSSATSLASSSSTDIFAFDGNDMENSNRENTCLKSSIPGATSDDDVLPKRGKNAKGPAKRKAAKTATRPRKRQRIANKGEDDNSKGCDPAEQNEGDSMKPLIPAKPKVSRKPTTSAACKSENFVRLNMKAKKFTRKGSRMTGAQWKRKQWKQKMSARSQSFGSNKCFRCGQSGHWANKCPQQGHITQPSIGMEAAPVDENGFPSLHSAALMARGIKNSGEDLGSDEEMAVEAMVVRERHEPDVKAVSATPLAELVTDLEGETERGLTKFGFTSFKPGQKETIRRILHGQSTLVILSTGGGKSLCYQLPAYLHAQHSRGITLVISPLVSLMEDQITGLPPGVRGACLNSNMTPVQRDSVLSDVNSGKVHFLLVSPEAVVGGGGRGQGSFPPSDKLPPIFFACIDEVHCLSEWSHNFRPSYLRLCKVLREKYGVSCFLGLTATATTSTARDVARHLDIPDMEAATVRGSPVPPNLCLSVSRDENKDEALVNLLQGKRFSECGSIIIYCTRREQVERVATLIRTCLQTLGEPKKKKGKAAASSPDIWTVETYHAGLTPAQRKRVQKAFMTSCLRVVVATVAFGMGLDKPDVRGIIHYNMPKSFESYVQEIGRAGRDGKTSHCHLFLDSQGRDVGELQRHTFGNSVDRYTLKRLLKRVFSPCKCQQVCQLRDAKRIEGDEPQETGDRACPGHERALPIQELVQDLDIREEGVETLLCYLELHSPQLLSNLSPVYATCQVQCYGGAAQLQAVAKKCPPVAVAIARQKLRGKMFGTASSLQFPVVEISDSMGWDSGPVKRELRALQWNTTGGGARKSGVLVTFTDLAFHVRACGDVVDSELDDLLDNLHERVTRQERAELAQLDLLGQRLRSVSHKNFWMCSDEADEDRSQALKKHLDNYFENKSEGHLENLELPDEEVDGSALAQLSSDIRQFVHLYGPEHSLTARAIARVFHGIDSPRFPAKTWGRVRRFWRAHLHVHFHAVLREASKQLLSMR